ncbi:MAG TPA: cupredoxin domain-containing protein [Frankiaceae bacterium]|jgi:uncharacterized cupredoxin-like copper-binding protein|nr:cupredoxin domain-containing protein [Frankiaceae bacterium]
MRWERGSAAVLALAAACSTTAGADAREVTLTMHWSRFDKAVVEVPRGVPVRFVYVNDDPIAHEVLVGDEAFHQRHETGAETHHGARPNETEVPSGSTVTTTLTFDQPGEVYFACHVPGHYAYGMKGTVRVV